MGRSGAGLAWLMEGPKGDPRAWGAHSCFQCLEVILRGSIHHASWMFREGFGHSYSCSSSSSVTGLQFPFVAMRMAQQGV